MKTWNERLAFALQKRRKTDADLSRVTGLSATTPHQLTLSIHPEIAKKVISDLQASLERLGSIQ